MNQITEPDSFNSLNKKYDFLKSQFLKFLDEGSVGKSDFFDDELNRNIEQYLERKDALKLSEEKYRLLYENAPIAFQSLNENGEFIDINPTWLSSLGYSREEIIGKKFRDFLHPEWQLNFDTNFPAFKKRGYVSDVEFKIRHKNGNYIHISFEGCIGTHPDGSFKQTYCVFKNITEQKLIEDTLRKNQYYLQKAQELGKIGTWELDLTKNILIWTKENYKIFGVPYGTKLNFEKFLEIVHPEDREYVNSEWARGIRINDYDIEHRLLIKDQVKWVREKAEIKYDEDGTPISAIGFSQDITKQKEYEERLLQSDRVFNLSLEMFCIAGFDGYFKFLNSAWQRVLGWSTKELLSKPWIEFVHPEDRENSEAIKETIIGGNKLYHFENRYLCKDGSVKWLSWNSEPYPDENIMIGAVRDITNQKEIEQELKKQNQYIKAILDRFPIGIATNKMNSSEVTYINQKFVDIYGWPIEDFSTIPDFFQKVYPDPNYREKMQAKIMSDIESGDPERMIWDDLKITTKSGEERIVFALNIPLPEMNVMVSTVQDVTQQKNAEKELLKAKEKAEESDRLKTAFLSNMSHEIRTPMNGILGFTNLLKEPNLSAADQKKYIDIIQKSGDRMLNTVNDIIEISKIEAGEITVTNSKVNVSQKITTLYEFFQNEALEKGLSFELIKVPEEANIIIESDSNKIDSVMSNLIKNAIKYTNKGGIKIGVLIKNDNLLFYCRDTGIGIPKEKHLTIFNRFEQADIENRQAYQGSGLGLSIAKHYADLLGGNLWVESQPEEGSVFYFSIPLHQSEIDAARNVLKRKESESDAKAKSRKLKTLIVEDDENSSLFLSIVLKDFASDILLAENGEKAVQVIKNHPEIELILLDIRMVGMNGIETAKQIRSFNKNVVIIGQSAYAFEEDKKRALEVGFNDYISKPVCKQKLENLINKYFN